MGYRDAEDKLIEIMDQPGMLVNLDGTQYEILWADKPHPQSGGEAKTDCYIALRDVNTDEEYAVKISYKSAGAEFMENKITPERACEIFGNGWANVIWNVAAALGEKLNNRPVIHLTGRSRGAFTLGWRCDIMFRGAAGELSQDIFFMRDQKLEVYSGAKRPEDKTDCYIGDTIVPESGIADYFYANNLFDFTPGDQSAVQEIFDTMIPLTDEFVSMLPELSFAFKAVNYRSFEDKYDHNRPLAIYNEWYINDKGQLDNTLLFGDAHGGTPPLALGADDAFDELAAALSDLGISTTADLNSSNLSPNVCVKG